MIPEVRRRDFSTLIERLLSPWDVWRAGEDKWRSRCPVHKGDNNTSFSIMKSGKFHCFRCSASGDMVHLVMLVNHLTVKQAQEYVGNAPLPRLGLEDIPTLPGTWKEAKDGLRYPVLREATLGPYRNNCPVYLTSRGFSAASLKKYEIGYDAQNSKIVIPVRDWQKKLVGMSYRIDFDVPGKPKYWHDNFQKTLHLWGFYFCVNKPISNLFLVEGPLDVVRMYQLGYVAAAIMGDDISREQVQLLRRYCKADNLVMAFDNDEAGKECTKRAIRKLSNTKYGQSLGVLKYSTKDPGELDEKHKIEIVPAWTRHGDITRDRISGLLYRGSQHVRREHA